MNRDNIRIVAAAAVNPKTSPAFLVNRVMCSILRCVVVPERGLDGSGQVSPRVHGGVTGS